MTRRGRPPGRTPQGEETRRRLFDTAIRLFADRGYEGTTLRAIAKAADVSPALVYRHFDNKSAIVMALYDELSTQFAETALPAGTFAKRLLHALSNSLGTLSPHRGVLVGVLPALLADTEAGLLSSSAVNSRSQVEAVFIRAVVEATDAPRSGVEIGQLAYAMHLVVLLFWTLDKSEGQSATNDLVEWLSALLPKATLALWLPGSLALLTSLNRIVRAGLITDRE